MAKTSSIKKNEYRKNLVEKYAKRRHELKSKIKDRSVPSEERFLASLKLAEMPRNGAKIRVRNRCELSGRPRGFFRKFNMSRIALRDLTLEGWIPGITKASW